MEELRFQITDEMEDERIDKCMSLLVENLSRSFIQKLIKDGNVLVNGTPVKGSCRVKCDDEVVFSVPESVEPDIPAVCFLLHILLQDYHRHTCEAILLLSISSSGSQFLAREYNEVPVQMVWHKDVPDKPLQVAFPHNFRDRISVIRSPDYSTLVSDDPDPVFRRILLEHLSRLDLSDLPRMVPIHFLHVPWLHNDYIQFHLPHT